ncbi:BNR repeat-containing protein [Serratia sp. UGAL515B_01]|uniref:BNR repeat-containing protein n=1 Tax=Serratia sp. UGAL515B_01 TaxID=2986763 RepID=UPI002953F000|nr:BNR repeat-containing protein [Serratia sp. UGAL515B_01]WON75641.1 BNR repeat-containing protein [Serratia sp. UGAL515B_01]
MNKVIQSSSWVTKIKQNLTCNSRMLGAALIATIWSGPILADGTERTRSNISCPFENQETFTIEPQKPWAVTAIETVADQSGKQAKMWAGYATNPSIVEHGDTKYIGYFDVNKEFTVAKRAAHEASWTIITIGEKLEHDSHSNVAMAIDTNGNLHVVARLRFADKLNYWMTTTPGELSTLTRTGMIPQWKDNGNSFEAWVSYPTFYTGVNGQLFFRYQHGLPGAAYSNIYQFNAMKRAWELWDPKTEYQGLAKVFGGWYTNPSKSAYPSVPKKGPDGRYHMIWTWRGGEGADSNSEVHYVVSDDMHVWKNVKGDIVSNIAFMYGDPRTVVDPVPMGGGLLNNSGMALGFDTEGKPIVSYFKYAVENNEKTTQLFTARPGGSATGNGWVLKQVSAWTGLYDLSNNIVDSGFLDTHEGVKPIGNYLGIQYLCQSKIHRLYLDPITGERVADVLVPVNDIMPIEIERSAFAPGNFIWGQYTFTEDSTDSKAVLLKWEAGPYIVNGDTRVNWTYPIEGSPLTVSSIERK